MSKLNTTGIVSEVPTDALEKQRRIEEMHQFYSSLNFEQRMELGPFVERLREESRQILQKMQPLAERAEELLAKK